MTAEQRQKLKRIRRVEKAITRLARMNLIYKLGGARAYSGRGEITGPAGPGAAWTDCSGFVLYLLAIAGVNLRWPNGWTGTLAQEGLEGTSPYLTVFLKEPEQTEGHTILRLRHHPRWRQLLGMAARYRWAECGGIDNPRAGDGPTWFRPTEERVTEFPYRRHFAQL